MIKALLIPISAVLMMSCSMSGNNQEKNLELIGNYVKAVENMDYGAMESYLDENYLGVGPSMSDSINKAQAVESWKANVDNLYERIKYNRSRNITATIPDGENMGEWVSNWAELTIDYKNDQGSVTILANTLYQIKDGKIIKSYTIYNQADALRQLGYVFNLPTE
jgi:hypothetical protein